jgi:hypothetical protein
MITSSLPHPTGVSTFSLTSQKCPFLMMRRRERVLPKKWPQDIVVEARHRHLFGLLNDVDIRITCATVVSQEYDTDVNKEYVIRGNSALLKCQFPSFMADHLQVESWMMDDGTVVTQSELYGTSSFKPSPYPTPPTHPIGVD